MVVKGVHTYTVLMVHLKGLRYISALAETFTITGSEQGPATLSVFTNEENSDSVKMFQTMQIISLRTF